VSKTTLRCSIKFTISTPSRIAEVEAALWYHDAIYTPRANDNERRSAELADTFLRSVGVSATSVSKVQSHIMATVHAAEPIDPDSRLVVDIDLSILGQDIAAYDQFERSVREEYKWVPWFLYVENEPKCYALFWSGRPFTRLKRFERVSKRRRVPISRER
jgi:predicted metal-dependent HD superfamily phosphohydrolase